MATTLPLTSIRIDGGTQSRVRIDEDTVRDYAEEYRAKTAMPPLVVYYDGKDYWLADGFHRFKAADRAGLLTLRCDVRKGTRKDAAWHSVGANRSHGLRRSNADKQNAVRMALELHPERSNRGIALHVGVSEFMVRDARPRCEKIAPEVHVGIDGKNYPPHRPITGTREPCDVPASDLPPPPCPAKLDERSRAPEDPPPPCPPTPDEPNSGAPEPPPSEPPEAEPSDRDARGREIPETRRTLWRRRQEVQEMLTALSRIKGALQHAQDDDDPLFRPVNFSTAVANLSQARASIEVALRRYVCPMCQGDGCQLCRDTGLLGEFAYERFVPKEFKL